PAPMGIASTSECPREANHSWHLPVHERNDLHYPWTRRCHPAERAGTLDRRGRGWHGLWLSGPHYWLCPGHLPGLFAPRGRDLPPRCPCWLSMQCHRIVAPPLPRPAHRGPDPVSANLGKVERGTAGEPPLLPRLDLLPLST